MFWLEQKNIMNFKDLEEACNNRDWDEVIRIATKNKNISLDFIDENKEMLLFKASEYGIVDLVKLLLKNGAKHDPDKNGATPLYIAAAKNNTEIIKLLLANGADHRPDNYDETPLFRSTTNGNVEATKLLLENGARDYPDQNGCSPMFWAEYFHHKKIIDLLKKYKADSYGSAGNNRNEMNKNIYGSN